VTGLTRRVPGAHLAPGLRDRQPTRAARDAWHSRDPEDVRASFDSYRAAWNRAGSPDHPGPAKEGFQ
jgi:hypothetical protein